MLSPGIIPLAWALFLIASSNGDNEHRKVFDLLKISEFIVGELLRNDAITFYSSILISVY